MKIDWQNIKSKGLKMMRNAWEYVRTHTVLVGFYLLAFVFFINSIFMTLHYINRNYDYILLDHLYIEAVLPDQDITARLKTGIVQIKEVNIDRLTVDDQVVICCDFGIDENWVEDVVSVDTDLNLVESTYDDVLVVENSTTNIFGVYIKDANFFGTIYYTSTFIRGYVFLMLSQIFILVLYYNVFVRDTLQVFAGRKTSESEERE